MSTMCILYKTSENKFFLWLKHFISAFQNKHRFTLILDLSSANRDKVSRGGKPFFKFYTKKEVCSLRDWIPLGA